MEAVTKLKYIRQSPYKIRFVADLIRGKTVLDAVLSKLNGVSVPWIDLPVVVFNVADNDVPGWVTWPICNCITSNALFSVATTELPPTSPEDVAVPPVVIFPTDIIGISNDTGLTKPILKRKLRIHIIKP